MTSLEHNSIRHCRLFSGLLTSIILLFPLKLLGAEQSTEEVQQPELFESLAYIDAPRDYLSGKIISYASAIDQFFGDERNYQETNTSVIQLALNKASGYGGSGNYVFAIRANINLPSTEKRLHLLIESNPDQNITGEPPENQQNTPITNNVDKPQSFGLALRYEKVKEQLKAMHLSADAGIKFQGVTNINPFVRARGSYSIPMDKWRLKAEQSVYWFNTIGVGETTQIDLEHLLSEPVLFRATSNATWLKDNLNFDLRQDLSIFHTVNERTALLYQASAIGVSNPQWELTEYRLTFLYRYRLHRNWMFFNISPQLHFPKTENFEAKYSLNMSLNMLFDKSN